LIHRAGYLTKQGDVIRSWRKRWFVLSDDALRYYRDESHDELKGEIALSSIIRAKVGLARGRGGRTATLVVETEDRDWLMQADSEASRDAWVQVINRLARHTARRRCCAFDSHRVGLNVCCARE
jgi:hypothetical protein